MSETAKTPPSNWKSTFLSSLSEYPLTYLAAQRAGVPMSIVLRHLEMSPKFKQQVCECKELSLDRIEKTVIDRALGIKNGCCVPAAYMVLRAHRGAYAFRELGNSSLMGTSSPVSIQIIKDSSNELTVSNVKSTVSP